MPEPKDFQEKYVQYNLAKQQLEGLAQELSSIGANIANLQTAKLTLDSIKDQEGKPDILVPIGGNSFLNAKVEDTKNVLTGVGSGVVLKKEIGEAIDTLETQITELEETKKKLEDSAKKLGGTMESLEPELQKMAAEMQQGQKPLPE